MLFLLIQGVGNHTVTSCLVSSCITVSKFADDNDDDDALYAHCMIVLENCASVARGWGLTVNLIGMIDKDWS